MQRKLLGISTVNIEAIVEVLIIYSVRMEYSRKNGNKMRQ